MTAVARALWALSDEAERASLIAWALRAEAVARALGWSTLGASDLTVTSDAARVGSWADAYTNAVDRTPELPPLSVVWHGASIWDGDTVVQQLLQLIRGQEPPAWSTILAPMRALRPELAAAVSQWQQPDATPESDRVRRAWWWRVAQQLTQTTQLTPPPSTTPPSTTPPSSSSPSWVLLAALAALVVSRRKGRR